MFFILLDPCRSFAKTAYHEVDKAIRMGGQIFKHCSFSAAPFLFTHAYP